MKNSNSSAGAAADSRTNVEDNNVKPPYCKTQCCRQCFSSNDKVLGGLIKPN